jgi:hypothetical protein
VCLAFGIADDFCFDEDGPDVTAGSMRYEAVFWDRSRLLLGVSARGGTAHPYAFLSLPESHRRSRGALEDITVSRELLESDVKYVVDLEDIFTAPHPHPPFSSRLLRQASQPPRVVLAQRHCYLPVVELEDKRCYSSIQVG